MATKSMVGEQECILQSLFHTDSIARTYWDWEIRVRQNSNHNIFQSVKEIWDPQFHLSVLVILRNETLYDSAEVNILF